MGYEGIDEAEAIIEVLGTDGIPLSARLAAVTLLHRKLSGETASATIRHRITFRDRPSSCERRLFIAFRELCVANARHGASSAKMQMCRKPPSARPSAYQLMMDPLLARGVRGAPRDHGFELVPSRARHQGLFATRIEFEDEAVGRELQYHARRFARACGISFAIDDASFCHFSWNLDAEVDGLSIEPLVDAYLRGVPLDDVIAGLSAREGRAG